MRQIIKNKKGQFGLMITGVTSLILFVTILVLGLVMIQKLRDATITGGTNCISPTNTTGCGDAYRSANASLNGLGSFGDFISITVLAIVTSVIIGLLLALFGGRVKTR